MTYGQGQKTTKEVLEKIGLKASNTRGTGRRRFSMKKQNQTELVKQTEVPIKLPKASVFMSYDVRPDESNLRAVLYETVNPSKGFVGAKCFLLS